MDCETAREWLEACRHDSDETDALPDGVAEHVEDCPHCRAAQESTARLDRLIGTRMRAVAVPEGLEERLLQRVAAAAAVADYAEPANRQVPRESERGEAPGATAAIRRRRFGRRRGWLGVAAGLAAAAALFVVWLLGTTPQWTPAEIEALVRTAASDTLEEMPRAHAVRPTQFLNTAYVGEGVKLLDGQRIAVLHYQVTVRGVVVQSEVYVIPKSKVSGPVPSYARLAPNTTGGMTIATWQEGDHVFVFVSRTEGEGVLRLFQRTHQIT